LGGKKTEIKKTRDLPVNFRLTNHSKTEGAFKEVINRPNNNFEIRAWQPWLSRITPDIPSNKQTKPKTIIDRRGINLMR
jgi:hypothetical protein